MPPLLGNSSSSAGSVACGDSVASQGLRSVRPSARFSNMSGDSSNGFVRLPREDMDRSDTPLLKSHAASGTIQAQALGFRIFPPQWYARVAESGRGWGALTLKTVKRVDDENYQSLVVTWPEDMDDWQHSEKKWTWTLEENHVIAGVLTAMHKVTMIGASAAEEETGVPEKAKFYAWSYAASYQKPLESYEEALAGFLKTGGFMYFDCSMRLVRINAVTSLRSESGTSADLRQDDHTYTLILGNAICLNHIVMKDLKGSARFHKQGPKSCFNEINPGGTYCYIHQQEFVSVEETPLGYPYGMFVLQTPSLQFFDHPEKDQKLAAHENAMIKVNYMAMPKARCASVKEAIRNIERGVMSATWSRKFETWRNFEPISRRALLTRLVQRPMMWKHLRLRPKMYALLFRVVDPRDSFPPKELQDKINVFPMCHPPLTFMRAQHLEEIMEFGWGVGSITHHQMERHWKLDLDQLTNLEEAKKLKDFAKNNARTVVKGYVAPVFELTIAVKILLDLGIPEESAYFCWSYPVPLERERKPGDEANFSNEQAFLANGGYIYFDRKLAVTAIMGVRAVPLHQEIHGHEKHRLGHHGKKETIHLPFGPPMPMPRDMAQTLAKRGRFRPMNHPDMERLGGLLYCWLSPSEQVGNEAIPRSFPHGAFCFIVDASRFDNTVQEMLKIALAEHHNSVEESWFDEHRKEFVQALQVSRRSKLRYEDLLVKRLQRNGKQLLAAFSKDQPELGTASSPLHEDDSDEEKCIEAGDERSVLSFLCCGRRKLSKKESLELHIRNILRRFRIGTLGGQSLSGPWSLYFGFMWYRFPFALLMTMFLVVSLFAGILIDVFIVVFQCAATLKPTTPDVISSALFMAMPGLVILMAMLVDELSDLAGDSLGEPFFLNLRTMFLAVQSPRGGRPMPSPSRVLTADIGCFLLCEILPCIVTGVIVHSTNPERSLLTHIEDDFMGAMSLVFMGYVNGLITSAAVMAFLSIALNVYFAILTRNLNLRCRRRASADDAFSLQQANQKQGCCRRRCCKSIDVGNVGEDLIRVDYDHIWRYEHIRKALSEYDVLPYFMYSRYEAFRRAFHNEDNPCVSKYKDVKHIHWNRFYLVCTLIFWIGWLLISFWAVRYPSVVRLGDKGIGDMDNHHVAQAILLVVCCISLTVIFSSISIKHAFPKLVGLPYFTVLAVFLLTFLGESILGFQSKQNVQKSDGGTDKLVPLMKKAEGPSDQAWVMQEARYAVCDMSWGSEGAKVSVLDLGALSWAAYAVDKADVKNMTMQSLAGMDAEVLHVSDYSEIPRLVTVLVKSSQQELPDTVVVAVKGSSTHADVFLDIDLFASIKLLQFFDLVIDVMDLAPPELVRSFLRWSRTRQGDQLANRKWTAVKDHVESMRTEHAKNGVNASVILTGHSLGGALAQIAAVQTAAPALVWSAPGSYFSQRAFGMSTEGSQRSITVVVPDFDQVAKVDRHAGAVQPIQCKRKNGNPYNPMMCHRLVRSACEVWRVCGDARKRNFTDSCDEYVDRSHLGGWLPRVDANP